MSILDYFPFPEFRELQRQVLLEIESSWDDYDIFVVVAPTASGKSALAMALANWQKSARILVPNNLLIDQYKNSFSELNTLKGKWHYNCDKHSQLKCVDLMNEGVSCYNCPLKKARSQYNQVTVTNMHLHASKLKVKDGWKSAPSTLIIDEAHNLVPFQMDYNTKRTWKHRNQFPKQETPEELLAWAKEKKHKELINALAHKNPTWVIDEDLGEWKGGGRDQQGNKLHRGEVSLEPQLKLVPVKINMMKGSIWKSATKKTILLSATIGRKDVESLGLGKKRVRYLECKHPIEPAKRPIVLDWVQSVSKDNFEEATKDICDHIENSGMLDHHKGEKGLIHATYAQSRLMKKYLKSSRFIFHNKDNKQEKYREFMDSKPWQGKVLVASGMYEGLDLPEDLGRWQVVAKIPWPSLADPAISYLYKKDREWYEWKTLKDVIQACGRISRTPKDFGVTYIVDKSLVRVLGSPLIPSWFQEALIDI